MAKLSRVNANVVARALDNGYFRRYAGTRPASISDALPGDVVLLAEHRFANPSAPAAVANVVTFTDLSSTLALATGRETFYRAFMADGVTVVLEGATGRNGYAADGVTLAPGEVYNLDVNNPNIQVNATVDMGLFTHEALPSSA